MYYRWSKTFLEEGKPRFSGDTLREANTEEVDSLRKENTALKEVVAAQTLLERVLKKKLNWSRVIYHGYMRYSPEEKMEIIRLAEGTNLGAKRTLEELWRS